jgi:hypothetical protein
MSKQQRVFVSGNSFRVTERPGYVKADLHGMFGWTSVWAPIGENTYTNLVRRIKQAQRGGQ